MLLLAGCARSAGAPAGGPDHAHDETANVQAQLAGDRLVPEIEDDPTFAGSAIDPQGLTIYAVQGGSVDLRAAVEAAQDVPARVVPAAQGNSLATLAALTERVTGDEPALRAVGIRLSSCGPDIRDNLVRVTLENYSPERAALLVRRYGGSGRLEVTTQSEIVAAS